MKIIYFLQNHSINLPEIWSDCSIYVCLWLVSVILLAIWSAKNYKRSVDSEYKEVTKTMVNSLNHEIDRLESENSYLKQAFNSYKEDVQRELIELRGKLPKRNSDGTFAFKTGKGHGKKDWTKATKEELLAEAKKRYPIGTKYKDIELNKEHISEKDPYFYTESKSYKYPIAVKFGGGFIFRNGKWAKIIKS